MKKRKSTHITRDKYYLPLEEKLKIRAYIHAHPGVPYRKIGDHFGISRGTVSNINRIPYHKEHYEKMIFQLTNHNNIISANMAAMGRQIILLKRKLQEYEQVPPAR
jgi:hypothetical protein